MALVLALALAGCSMGAHIHYAPAGSGLAASAEGPGAEGSVTDKNGVTVVSGSISINPIALASDALTWIGGLFQHVAPKPAAGA